MKSRDVPESRRSPSKPRIFSVTFFSKPFKTAMESMRAKHPTAIPVIAIKPVNLLVPTPLSPNRNRFAM